MKTIKLEVLMTLSLSELDRRCTEGQFDWAELRQTHTFNDIDVDSILSLADLVIKEDNWTSSGDINPPSPIDDGVLFGLLYLKNGMTMVTRQTKSQIETMTDIS